MTKPTGNRKGRPPKSAALEIKQNRGVGRPKGDKAILDEYKMMMLVSPKSEKVLTKVFDIALNDEHPGQMAAMKLVMDRLVPAGAFDTSKGNSGQMPQISINISSLNAPTIQSSDDVIDVGVTDIDTQ